MAVAASKIDIREAACITGIPGTTEREAQAKDSAGSTSDILDLLAARGIHECILGHLRLLPVTFFFNLDALTDQNLVALGVDAKHHVHRRRFLVELKNVLADLAEQAGLPRTTGSVSNPGSCRTTSSKGKKLSDRPQSARLPVRRGKRPQSAVPVTASAAAKTRPASACSAASAPGSAFGLAGRPAKSATLARMKPGNPRFANHAGPGSSGRARLLTKPDTTASAASHAGYGNWRWPYVDPQITQDGSEVKQLVPKPPPRPRSAGRSYAKHRKEMAKPKKRTISFIAWPAHTPTAAAASFVEGSSPLASVEAFLADSDTEQDVSEQSEGTSFAESRMIAVQESGKETPYIDGDSWLEHRLMPGGPLAIIEALQRAAAGGDVELLRSVIQKAEIHGPSFLKCIDSQPVSCRLYGSDNTHKDPQKVPGLWTWASHRLAELGRAESELADLVEDGVRALQNARRLAPTQDETPKMSTAVMGVDRNRHGTPDLLQQDPQSVAFRDVDASPGSSSANGNQQQELHGRRSWSDVKARGLIRDVLKQRTARCFDKAVTSTSFLSAQKKLVEAAQSLRSHVRVVDESVALEGPIRNQAAAILVQLQDCQEDLFDRFVVFRKPIESELWAASDVDIDDADRILTLKRLRTAISTARQEVGAQTLIGEAAVAWAEKQGIGIYQKYNEDQVEPPSPWANIKTGQPPWEASYRAAVTRFLEVSQMPGEEETSFHAHRTAFDAQEVSFVRQLQAANMLEAPYEKKTSIDGASRRGAVVKRTAANETMESDKLPTLPAEDEVASPEMRTRPKLSEGFSNAETVASPSDLNVEEDAELFKRVRNKARRAKTVSFGGVAEEVTGCPGKFFERDSLVIAAGS